jgi:response regulator RpfG family c-di-GMP phosphodiesterase
MTRLGVIQETPITYRNNGMAAVPAPASVRSLAIRGSVVADVISGASVEDISGQPDQYVNHLAEVNKTNDVVCTDDIYNKHGVLLVRKGARIGSDMAQRVLQHKLMKPLEEQVQLGRTLNAATVLAAFVKYCEAYPDIRQIHSELDFDKRFKNLVQRIEFANVIAQKLTVLQDRLPQKFENAVLCGWLATLIATEMNLTSDLVQAVLLAGLTHDVGLLHIPLEIVNKTGELTVVEWRAMQSHVVVGQILLKNTKNVHPRAPIAVIEHHERCDGSGYPVGKTEEQLDVLGQIIGIADSVLSIRLYQFSKHGRNFRDALPYLHMNSATHSSAVYNAMHALLIKSKLQPTQVNTFQTSSALVNHLAARGNQLKNVVTVLEELLDLALLSGVGTEAKRLYKVTQPVVRMISSSGLLREEILAWLQLLQQQPDDSALGELIESELMQNELYWQIKKVQRMLNDFVEQKVASLSTDDQARVLRIQSSMDAIFSTNK